MTELRLGLLGPPLVERDGRPVAFDTRKALALLALVAVDGRDQSRQRLAAMLWPGSDDFRARGALRRTLSVAVAALGGALVVGRHNVRLDPSRIQVDVLDFERMLSEGGSDSLETAVRLYRDDFMAGFGLRDSPDFDDWQETTGARLSQRLGTALEELVGARVARGDLVGAVEHAQRWLSLDQLHEPAHQALIRLYGWSGQRAAAARQYRDCVRELDRELGVAPLPQTTELYEQVLAGTIEPAASTERLSPQFPPTPRPATPSPFVGRSAESAALLSSWRSVGPQGRAVALMGEIGSGKSTLIAQFSQSLQAGGTRVLAARGHQGESGLPYIAVADLLRSARSIRPDLAERLPRQVALEVGRLAPELAPAAAAPSALDSPAGLARLYAAIASTLTLAFAEEPGVVVLEDAQLVDQRSLDVLGYLLRRLPELPLLLVVSWAPESAERLRAVLAALAEATDSGLAQVIALQLFEAEEVRQLLEKVGVPDADLPRLMDETRGLPLLVRAYADALVQGETAPGPPASAREVLSRRLAAVGQPATQLMSAAAVLGRGFDAELLRAVSGRGEAEVVDGLEAALAHALLVEAPAQEPAGAPTYDFPYEALRQVAYDSTSLARRRLIHSRTADALARRQERDPGTIRAATVAYHLQGSGREAEASQWWWAAAERSRSLYAHAEALAHIAQARALGYPEVPALLASGEALTALGRYGEALQAFELAAAGVEGDDQSLAEVEHRLAEVHHRVGDWALAASHLRTARELLPAGQAARRAGLEADLALVAYRQGDFAQAAVLGESALALARKAREPRSLAQATDVLGVLASRSGDRGAAEPLLRESLEHAQRIADPGPAVAALNNLARLLADTGRLAEALVHAERALQLGSEHGDQHRVAALHTNLADLLHADGQHQAAREHLTESARLFAAVDPGAPIRPEIWSLVEW